MSKTIDEKVVEMRFDNKDFESNVKTSMSTIEKLKRSLNFSGSADSLESIGKAANNVNMSGLSGAVETVQAKFSALQVMAITTLANITNSAVNAGKRLVSSLTIDQATAGWTKYEQKTASVQTIMNATGKTIDEVNGYLDKLMWYSDETSYGFTDMTQSLGQLTSAGGKIENLIPMIEGIANATAFAGKGATEFSRAIYNLNQSYSAGYLQYMDWRSLELAGVASKQLKQVFIDTAEAMGKVAEGQITIANFSETLKDKWADTEVMEAAFGRFAKVTEAAYAMVEDESNIIDTATVAYKVLSGELDKTSEEYLSLSDAQKELVGTFSDVEIAAAKSAQEAKTFTEAIEATKDAVSSGWMKTAEIIFGNYEESKKVWTELTEGLWEVFAAGGEKRNDLLAEAFGSKWEQFTSRITDAGISIDDFQSKLADTLSEHGKSLDDLISEYGSLEAAIASGEIGTNSIVETIKKFAGAIDESSKSTENMTDKLEYFQKVVDQVWNGDFSNGAERIKQLTEAGYDYATVQDLVNKTVDGHRLTLDDLSDAQLENMGYTEEQIESLRVLAKQAEMTGTPINELIESMQKPSGRELFIGSFRNILGGIASVIQTSKDAWGDIFAITPEGIYDAIEAFHKLSEAFVISKTTGEKLKRSLKGVFAILDIAGTIAGGIVKNTFKVLGELFYATTGEVLDLTASVGDSIVSFRNWFKEHNVAVRGLNKVGDALVRAIKKVKSWIDAFKELQVVQETISNIKEALSTATNNIQNWNASFGNLPIIQKSLSKIKKALSDISASKIVKFIEGCYTAVKNLLKAFLELPIVKKIVDGLQTAFKKARDTVKDFFSEGLDRIIDFIDRCKELDGLTLENIKAAFKDFYDNVFTYFFNPEDIKKNIINAAGSFVDAFWNIDERLLGAEKSFKKFKTNITTNLFGAGGKLEWFKKKLYSLTDLAQEKLPSLFAMASAAVLIKTLDKVGKALDTLATPLNTIKNLTAGFVDSLKIVAKGLSFQAKAAGIRDLAIAIALLAGSLWIVAQIPSDKLLASVGAIAVLIGMLALLSLAIGKIKNLSDVGELAKASLSFIALAGALIMIAGAIKIMESVDFNSAWKNAIILGGLAVALSVAVGVLNKISGGKSAKAALTMIGMAIAIKLLVSALVDLDGIAFNHLEQSLLALVSIVGILGALALACSFVKFGTGLGILGLVVGIKLFISIFDDIEKLDLDKVTANVDKFKMVFGMLAVLMLSMKLAGRNAAKAGVGILAMSAGILILTHAIKDIAKINDADIEKGTIAISKLLLMFGIVTAFTHFAGDNAAKAGRAMVTMSVGIVILAGAIYLLSGIDYGALDAGVAAISKLLLMFGVVIVSTKAIPKNAVATLISLEVGIVALIAAVALLCGLDQGAVKNAVESLSIVMGMFALLIASTRLINTEGKAFLKIMAVLAVLTGIVGSLAFILKKISLLPVRSTLANAAGLSGLLLAITASIAILSRVKSGSEKALFSLAVVTLIVGGLAGILGLIQDLPVESTLANAASLSVLILALSGACALLSLVPATGATAGIIALLEVFGATGLIVLVAAILDLIPGVKEAMNGGLDLLKDFANGLGEVIGAFITGIGEGLTENLYSVADNLSDFTDHLQPFIEDVQNIEPGSMAGLKDLCDSILGISISSLINMFTGQSLEDFGTQLKAFGEAICAYSSAVSADGAINQEAIDASITAANKLVELAYSVPSSGLISMIIGEKNLGTFGSRLTEFGTGICEYSKAVSADGAIDLKSIHTSVSAGKKLVELAKTLPESGLIQSIVGEQNLGTFGSQLAEFGSGIVSYGEEVKGVDANAVETSITSANRLVSLANRVSILDVDSGKISDFADGAEDIGEAIGDFTDSAASEWNPSTISMAVASCDYLIDLTGRISNTDTSGVKNFKMALDELATVNLTNFSNSFGAAGLTSATNMATGFTNGIPMVRTSVSSMMSRAEQEASGHTAQFTNAGSALCSGIGAGIGVGGPGVSSAAASVASRAVSAISNKISEFTSIGGNMMDGLKGGILSKAQEIASAAANAVSGAIQAAKNALGIASPSKVFAKIGKYVDEGFIKGLLALAPKVANSSEEMAGMAIDGAKSIISTIGSIPLDGTEFTPSITPVVDMSNLDTNYIKFGADIDMSMVRPINSLSQIVSDAQSEINASNAKVIEAINDLREDLNNLYNFDDKEIALYVDSKKLATSLAKPMNRELNILSKRGAY